MQPNKKNINSNAQISNRRVTGSRASTQPSQLPAQQPNNNNANTALKQREDALINLVKDYLQKSGFPRTLQTFKNQKPVRRILPPVTSSKGMSGYTGNDEQKTLLNLFDKGSRQQFFRNINKLFFAVSTNPTYQEISQAYKKLEFELQIYFCIFSVHPFAMGYNKKNQNIDKTSLDAFKKFIDSKGNQISQQGDLLTFFALPYVPKPQQNVGMAKVFTKQWIPKLRMNLQQIIRQCLTRNAAISNKENKKTNSHSLLHDIYDKYQDMSVSQSRIKEQVDHKEVEKYRRDIEQLKLHNKQMISYLDIMQQNLKAMNEASKTNLVESNRKWFQFSKQIMQLTKKALKGQNVKEKLQKYERFFGTNIQQLIYATDDISLFQKNSYTEDHSMIPGTKLQRNSINQTNQITPIDVAKISNLFMKANRLQYSQQICIVLKALKQRLYCHKNVYLRREIVVSYQRNDLCAIKDSNYEIQKKLLLDSPERVKQFYLRLMNYISTDDLGNQYLSGSEKLIKNLIQIMGSTTEEVPYRKHVFGILQRFSFIKQSQLMMISFGIIPMIFKIFRNEAESLQDTSIQYLMGLIMNLAVKKQSIINFQKHKSEIIPILLKYIDVEDSQIKGYVNGTLYVLLQLQSIKREAIEKYKLKDLIKSLYDKSVVKIDQLDSEEAENQNCVIRQYSYILERLDEVNTTSLEDEGNYDDDDEQEQYAQDLQQIQIFSDNESNSSEYIEGEEGTLNGQQLLMKKYALLGPQAVRQQIINRSILDETSRKSNNMTTSINHSKRMDKVFHKNERPETPSLLPGNLDLSITPNK